PRRDRAAARPVRSGKPERGGWCPRRLCRRGGGPPPWDRAQGPARARANQKRRGNMTVTRAILIAAGRGKRLGAHTEEIPKCMVQVGRKPILGWVWDAFRAAGIEELVVIRGYRGDVLEAFVRALAPKVSFVDNTAWQTN